MSRWWPAIVGAALGVLVCLRTLIVFTPLVWFDVDPLLDPNPFAGLGPAGSLLIDGCIAVVSAAMVLCFAGRAAGMIAVAALAVLVLRCGNESQLGAMGWRGWQWIVAFLACAAAVAVARNPRQQARLAWSALVATMLGVCCLWLARGSWQWFYEHPSTVQFFQTSGRDLEFFNDRGWDPAGPQAQGYLRRLEQREMTGWFGLANLFSGVMAVAAVAIAGLPRPESRKGASWGMLAAACAAVVLVNGSKGAIAAMLIGFAAVAALRWMRIRPALVVTGAVTLVLASSIAAIVRGTVCLEMFPHERSLLFRWHYLQTAWTAWRENPWIGTGPDGFKDASSQWRPADAVELVQSAHAAFADWVAQLGVAGFVWIAVAMSLLIWSARGAARESRPLPTPGVRDGTAQRVILLAVIAAVVVSVFAELHTMDGTSLLIRLVGGIAWAGTAVMLMPRVWAARSSGARMLFPAALVVLCHAQVEMTLWNPGSSAWLLVVLGASVPPHALEPDSAEFRQPLRWWPRLVGAACAVFAAIAVVLGSSAARRMETSMHATAEQLLREMHADSGISPHQARRNAADALRAWSRLLACDQLLRAAAVSGLSSPRGKEAALAAALDADSAVKRGAGLAFATHLDALHMSALAWEIVATASQQPGDRTTAMQRALAVTSFDRRAASAWLRAARMAASLGRPDAVTFAGMAIAADDSNGLDPLARLSQRDRAEAQRLAGITLLEPDSPP